MKCHCLTAASLLLILSPAAAPQTQPSQPIPIDTAQKYFAEAQTLCHADDGHLWGVSLCGPLMFIDPDTRFIVANQADANGLLKSEDGVFIGSLPADLAMGNTSADWSGTRWTEILWPLPNNQLRRDTLIAHELFHRIQNQLGFPPQRSDNSQMDTLQGRYLLQLEWRALARALEATSDHDRRAAAADALLFRAERYRLFPGAAADERALELNEGLAEYTGVRVGNPTPQEQLEAALHDIATHQHDSTFVRSFAYATGPAYGLLLDRCDPTWHQQLKPDIGFDTLLQRSLSIKLPAQLHRAAEQRATLYDGAPLLAAEQQRDARRQQILALYRRQFIEGPVLTLPLKHMQVQFDPRTLQPLDKAGTVYPGIHISDDWGILNTTKGALLRSDWSTAIVAAPATTSGTHLQGDGWTLDLKPGWKIVPAARKGDLTLAPGS